MNSFERRLQEEDRNCHWIVVFDNEAGAMASYNAEHSRVIQIWASEDPAKPIWIATIWGARHAWKIFKKYGAVDLAPGTIIQEDTDEVPQELR